MKGTATTPYHTRRPEEGTASTTYVKDVATVGSPGTTRSAITVAAVNNQGNVLQGKKLVFGDNHVLYYLALNHLTCGSVKKEPVKLVIQALRCVLRMVETFR